MGRKWHVCMRHTDVRGFQLISSALVIDWPTSTTSWPVDPGSGYSH